MFRSLLPRMCFHTSLESSVSFPCFAFLKDCYCRCCCCPRSSLRPGIHHYAYSSSIEHSGSSSTHLYFVELYFSENERAPFSNTFTGMPQVCYGKYGCFNQFPPFANILMKLPQSPDVVGAKFHLYTRENTDANSAQELDDSDLSKLTASNFNISRRTIIVCHGWTGKAKFKAHLLAKKEPCKREGYYPLFTASLP